MEQEQTKTIILGGGIKLGYRLSRASEGPSERQPTLVMLHGLASNHTRWSEFVENTALKSSWNLLRMDLRGHGLSMCRGRISRKHWCGDLRRVLEEEGLENVILLGHSLGAQVALDYAVRYPDEVAGLILIDPVLPSLVHGTLGRMKRLKYVLWLGLLWLWLLNALGFKRREFPMRDLRALDRKTRRVLATDPDADIARLYAQPKADWPYLPLANYLQDILAVLQPVPSLHSIHTPVWVLLSTGTSLSDLEAMRTSLSALPQGRIVEIEADHWLLTEQPEAARLAIEAGCREIQAAIQLHPDTAPEV